MPLHVVIASPVNRSMVLGIMLKLCDLAVRAQWLLYRSEVSDTYIHLSTKDIKIMNILCEDTPENPMKHIELVS